MAQAPRVPLPDIVGRLNNFDAAEVEAAIQQLDRNGLLRIVITRDAVELTVSGKIANERHCAAEICLGAQYLAHKYAGSVVHVLVRDAHGDEGGGTGFFCSDFPGWIATARHVVEEHTIARV